MVGGIPIPALLVGLGVLALIAAYVVHWVLLAIGIALMVVGVYLAFGGTIGPL
jgi:hypothetical protein